MKTEHVKELSKEQKLKLIDLIFEGWMSLNREFYICVDIYQFAFGEDFISKEIFRMHYPTEVALQLIPELVQIRPSNLEDPDAGWFGNEFEHFGGTRTKKLLELKEIIEKS